jgi:cardiolipin synthase (CMP-forming)
LIQYLPNLISIARLCLAPYALRAIWNREYEWALLWCLIAGLSDFLDGFLARRLRVASTTGAYLDPLADKILLSGVYFMLGYDRVIPWWVTAVVFGRDALMLLFFVFAFAFTKLREFPPTVWGKLSTAIQIVTALVILLGGIMYFGPHERLIKNTLIGLTVAATAWSALDYLRVGLRMVTKPKPRP